MVYTGTLQGEFLLDINLSQLASIYYFTYLPFKRAAPMAYRGSQARGGIGAVAASLPHSHGNAGSELHLQPTCSSWQLCLSWILNLARSESELTASWILVGFVTTELQQ